MRILVLRKSGGLGDIVCCEPAVRGLREKYENAEIVFSVPPEYVPLFDNRSEIFVKSFQPAQFTHKWMEKYLEDWDVVFDLRGPEASDEAGRSPEHSRIESFCHLVGVRPSPPVITLTEREKDLAHQLLAQHPRPWVGLAPRGKFWAKNWPIERWEELAADLEATCFYLDQKEPPPFSGTVPVVGGTLRELAAVLSQLDLLISVDTGPLHLAAAVGTKTLSLWGPTDPRRTLKHYAEAHYVTPERPCGGPCLSSPTCRDSRGYAECMIALDPKVVLNCASALLDGKKAPSMKKAKYYKAARRMLPEKKADSLRIVWVSRHLLPTVGGAERYAVELLKKLAQRGHEVVAIWTQGEEGSFRQSDLSESDGVFWMRVPQGALLPKVLDAEPDLVMTQLAASRKLAKGLPPDMPMFLFLQSVAETFCSQATGAKGCLEGGPVELMTCGGCENSSYVKMRATLERADEVFAVSNAMAQVYENFTGRKARVQYPVPDPARCRVESAEPGKYCVSLKVTNGRGRAFLDNLARVMPEQKFLWVDSAPSARSNVEVVPHTEDLSQVFKEALVLLCPSIAFEAFGRTPVEAGWARIPTLASDCGGLPEAVGDGGLVLPLEPDAWASTIRRLRDSRMAWEDLSRSAREHAESFSWETLDEVMDGLGKAPKKRKTLPKTEPVKSRTPLVSVVIPTYNRAELVTKSIDSVLEQKYPALEVLVVDDASTDETDKVCAEYGDKIKYIKRPKNGNTARTLNTGIKASTGEFICWLSSDDYFEDEKKTAKQVALFQKDPELRLVHSEFLVDWGDGRRTVKGVPTLSSQKEALDYHLNKECLINGSSVMFDRRIFYEIGMFNPAYRYCQDSNLWARALGNVKVGCIHEPLVSNLQHEGILGAEYMEPKTDEQHWNRKLFDVEKELMLKQARMFGSHPSICVEICMKNEEDMMDRCLNDLVQRADQIVIFNDGSTDRSVEIAEQYPKVTEIFSQPDKGNVRTEAKDRQKLLEIAQATGCDFVFFADADEIVETAMKWDIYDLVTAEDVNLYYFLQVNLWRSMTQYRTDEMWYKGWFGRLFRNLPGLRLLNEHDEHCGGIPGNIPGAPVWPTTGSTKGVKSDIRVKHYGFVDWNRTVERAARRWERDPYRIENGQERGGFKFYERMIDSTGLELREYEGDSVADYLRDGRI